MRSSTRLLASLTALACGAATVVVAQRPQTREGFWIGFGFGYGSAHGACSSCGGANWGGATAFLKLGVTLSPSVLLGGAVNGWSKSRGGVTTALGNVTASVFYYPAVKSGLFVTGGLGFSDYMASGDSSTTGNGWGFTLGAGYDVRVGRNVSLTPSVHFVYGGVGDLQESGTTVLTGWRQRVIDFSLGITFH
jgi:hypothetical protein